MVESAINPSVASMTHKARTSHVEKMASIHTAEYWSKLQRQLF